MPEGMLAHLPLQPTIVWLVLGAYCNALEACSELREAYRSLLEEVIEPSGLASHIPVVVSGQIAHGAVQPLQLLYILWQPVA